MPLYFAEADIPLIPQWPKGTVVTAIETHPGFSRVTVHLPQIPEDHTSDFTGFTVEWRPIGEDWDSTVVDIKSSTVTLPADLADGSYEVRVFVTDEEGRSVPTMPFQFPLPIPGKYVEYLYVPHSNTVKMF